MKSLITYLKQVNEEYKSKGFVPTLDLLIQDLQEEKEAEQDDSREDLREEVGDEKLYETEKLSEEELEGDLPR